MSTNKRSEIKRKIILRAAIEAARRPGGWSQLTRLGISRIAGCAEASVSQRLGDMKTVRRLIIRAAVKDEILEIIAQSVAAHDSYANALPSALKQRAIASLLG